MTCLRVDRRPTDIPRLVWDESCLVSWRENNPCRCINWADYSCLIRVNSSILPLLRIKYTAFEYQTICLNGNKSYQLIWIEVDDFFVRSKILWGTYKTLPNERGNIRKVRNGIKDVPKQMQIFDGTLFGGGWLEKLLV